MKLKLRRTRYLPDRTIGQLYVNDEFFCFSMEDKVRDDPNPTTKEHEGKVYGETAIPEGIYRVTLEQSPRFGENTITIHDVPSFSGIRIHSGNGPADSLGCPIIGYKLTKDNSTIAFGTTRPCVTDLKEKLKQALKTEKVEIHVVNM